MNPVATEQDLEILHAGQPICEDDHLADGGEPCPPCDVIATARLRWACTKTSLLICQSMVEWIVAPPRAYCTACRTSECLSISFL